MSRRPEWPASFNTFDEQIADTLEIGWKGQFADGRVNTSLAYYTTELSRRVLLHLPRRVEHAELGSLDEVEYDGVEFELNAQLTDALSA